MATSAQTSRPIRRSMSTHAAPSAVSIARGATARSAVSPKANTSLNGIHRRGSLSAAALNKSLSLLAEVDVTSTPHENLVNSLKRETEEKEELLLRVQNKEQTITELTKENTNLTASLNTAETRLSELYADQARIEEETAARLELVERLRIQIQELERDKRELQRRYNEQTATFDAERQSFYDNEQHLKSRIQSLVQARKVSETSQKPLADNGSFVSLAETEVSVQSRVESPLIEVSPQARDEDNDSEPAEMTSLRLELSTLSTSYSSLQTTVQHLSAQLLDLKRVNNQLQEENESYNSLLREKTINGQFDILRTVGTEESNEGVDEDEVGDDVMMDIEDEEDSSLSRTRSPLDPVDELAEDIDPAVYGEEHADTAHSETGSQSSHGAREQSRRFGRGGRRNAGATRSPDRKGESLADLPVAGPGLDLAAELGRAENQAYIDGKLENRDTRHRSASMINTKRGRRTADERKTTDVKGEPIESSNDIDALRNEVKSLKDANRALSLYASKIIDRIIAQEGYEHVLAADYEKPQLPPPKSPQPQASVKKDSKDSSAGNKARNGSAIFGLTLSSSDPAQTGCTPPAIQEPPATKSLLTVEDKPSTKLQRRSLSFDWRGFSMFGSSPDKKPEQNPNLRPLALRPGTTVVSARKLDTLEDEEDRKERERLHATMKLLGIDKPITPVTSPNPILRTPDTPVSSPNTTPNPDNESSSSKSVSRFSFFRSRSNTSDNSVNVSVKPSLTAEALERAEAETTLAALDEREKFLSAEIAKGSHGGFTELPNRKQRGEEWRGSKRSRRSGGSGSGSTVWSAGMSTQKGEDSADEQGRPR